METEPQKLWWAQKPANLTYSKENFILEILSNSIFCSYGGLECNLPIIPTADIPKYREKSMKGKNLVAS